MSINTNWADAEVRTGWLSDRPELDLAPLSDCVDTTSRDMSRRTCYASWFVSHDRESWAACPSCGGRR
jgi:hypothetical protein